MEIRQIDGYTVGFSEKWFAPHIKTVLDLTKNSRSDTQGVLSGRRQTDIIELPPGKSIVLKHYARGGGVGHIMKRTYFCWGKSRSRREFEWLQQVRRIGVRAPEPIAFIRQGRCFQKCWLVTAEIKHRQSLADAVLTGLPQRESILSDLTRQMKILIENRILHVDLHPGNILIDNDHRPHIIDFDKAGTFRQGRSALIRRYLSRWQRAVLKHDLDPMLIGAFEDCLRAPSK